ncbi:Sperm tail [Carpediemonas membranifera]|uniref:Dynein regulatory complex subunit 2 n=1 Tax=Carpediemonas membranifera TaxID=201153 RepID=A0A8J6E715_9EUKA|nr:Sperm tail [Carpediemonas membranifera]|eukprot:KAG9390175.1 Sperm tail [Carpediemonas membranifera]
MPKKGKSKGKGKKSKETEEERRARLELERQMAEEARKQYEDTSRVKLRMMVEEERKASAVNKRLVQEKYVSMLKEKKADELRHALETVAIDHGRHIDSKDAIIQMLDRYLDLAEEQYQRILRAHLTTLDRLTAVSDRTLGRLASKFKESADSITAEFTAEMDEIKASQERAVRRQKDIIEAIRQDFASNDDGIRQEFQSMLDEMEHRNTEEYNVLRLTLESNIEELERHFVQAHQQYLQSTETRTQHFKLLTMKDQQNAKTIEEQTARLDKLQAALSHWKTKLANTVQEYKERNAHLTEERDQLLRHFQGLKRRMDRFRKNERERLTTLCVEANEGEEKLDKDIKLLERVMTLQELCARELTCLEQVKPFDPYVLDEQTKKDIDDAMAEHGGEVGETNMHNFFRRLNKAKIDVTAMQNLNRSLKQENAQLKVALQTYLENISVSDVTFQQENPLLIIN